MTASQIILKNINLSYQSRTIFKDFNWPIHTGKWISVLGASGIGKTSLIRIMVGLVPYIGQIIYENSSLSLQQQIAYMPQQDSLFPWLNVFENVTVKLKLQRYTAAEKVLLRRNAKRLLSEVGLDDAHTLYPAQLSGGMKQRVALVRTLLENRPIIIMDEPFSALDAITRFNIQALAYKLLQKKTVIFITHDPLEALRLSDQIYILHNQPAQIKLAVELTTSAPRALNNPEVLQWQGILFDSLSQAHGQV